MSEENITNEALELVKEAQSTKVFNLADAIKGRAYPTTSVRVYLNDQAALELVEINQLMNRITDPDKIDQLSERAAELAVEILSSSLVFEMRGIGQREIDEISTQLNKSYGITREQDGPSNSDWLRDYIVTLVGKNIVTVTNYDGAVDNSQFDLEKSDELRKSLSVSEWNKLVGAMQKLTLAGGYFDQLTDAGFLQKS
jgi:hypothetical protein